ncbi:hypothetical protein [Actinoplanes sp. NPDC051494]|uniref:hypothetical protein n=1 Tax=Actinoplanes sp. NPDC051494 TaxID=3363907 RepID=UPI0037AA38B6
MRNRRTTALLGVLAAGALLTQQACAATSTSPSQATAPTASGEVGNLKKNTATEAPDEAEPTQESSSGDPILAGKRQIVIKPIPGFESIVAVDDKGRLGLTDGEAEHGLFVLTPHNGKYLIKTAKADSSGEPSCMGIKNNGSSSLTVVATACDAGRAGQLFTITEQDAKEQGDPTYSISAQGAFLQVFPDGLIAEELGDAPLETTYAFVDNGPSTLPALD